MGIEGGRKGRMEWVRVQREKGRDGEREREERRGRPQSPEVKEWNVKGG